MARFVPYFLDKGAELGVFQPGKFKSEIKFPERLVMRGGKNQRIVIRHLSR